MEILFVWFFAIRRYGDLLTIFKNSVIRIDARNTFTSTRFIIRIIQTRKEKYDSDSESNRIYVHVNLFLSFSNGPSRVPTFYEAPSIIMIYYSLRSRTECSLMRMLLDGLESIRVILETGTNYSSLQTISEYREIALQKDNSVRLFPREIFSNFTRC